jgi:hypothetical protein
MQELTEREKELLGYIDKLLKFHALFMQVYVAITQVAYSFVMLQDQTTEQIKKIDPFSTIKNTIESLNVNFGTNYPIVEGKKSEILKPENVQ